MIRTSTNLDGAICRRGAVLCDSLYCRTKSCEPLTLLPSIRHTRFVHVLHTFEKVCKYRKYWTRWDQVRWLFNCYSPKYITKNKQTNNKEHQFVIEIFIFISSDKYKSFFILIRLFNTKYLHHNTCVFTFIAVDIKCRITSRYNILVLNCLQWILYNIIIHKKRRT